jgi:hypothetical protein
MSIPLDRLYHFVDNLCGGDIVIYRFSPHGSKKITDLTSIKPLWSHQESDSCMICYDQEPLNYNYYSNPDRLQEIIKIQGTSCVLNCISGDRRKRIGLLLLKKNMKMIDIKLFSQHYVFLLHSEKNSQDLATYEQSGFIGVYWWSHAIIARDWFRFAEHDLELNQKNILKDFLIYNRAWSGTREYRLKFAELIVQQDLQNHCTMKFNPKDNGQHYQNHLYQNPGFTVDITPENHFELNTYDATASADYVAKDYISTGIEVVLETLFDDDRWHLTEKILRPIACGHPFMLAATPGALEYLRSYGFRTFSPLINENYDTIQDPVTRLVSITSEMRRIADLPAQEKQTLFDQLREIALHNRQLFFSSTFHDNIIQELKNNLKQGQDRLLGS